MNRPVAFESPAEIVLADEDRQWPSPSRTSIPWRMQSARGVGRGSSAMAVVWALAFAAVSLGAAPQLLPPPKDGDIRDVYWELRKESETWLSLELKTEDGRPAPFLTFTHFYSGKPPGPPA